MATLFVKQKPMSQPTRPATVKPTEVSAKKPSMTAVRRAIASSTALETGQSVQELEQKLKDTANRRFAHIKLAP